MMQEKKGSSRHGLLRALVGVLLVYVIVFMAFAIRTENRKAQTLGKAPQERHTITVDGTGKIVGSPDIATIDVGVTTDGKNVQAAMEQNTSRVNALVRDLKAAGIASADIQTNRFNVYPKYDYSKSRSEIIGYTVDQGMTVKIRALEKASSILQVVTIDGANQVSGLTFKIEDPDKLRGQARDIAIKNAGQKAGVLAAQLGLKIVRIVNFNESGSYANPMYYDKYAPTALGVGGGSPVPAPAIEPGSQDVISNVSITYEIE